jgi:Ser/Thr protein kinase RdoA (MazF antagonist)
MWKVDSTIGDDGSSPIAERILERWDHDSGSVRFFRSSANFLYLLRRQGEDHFLQFTDSSERTRASIDADVDLVSWLAGAGIDVALPVPSKLGHRVETVDTD